MLNRENIKNIGIFRALQLGDLMCSVPAFRALRHAFPEARITLIGLPWAKSFTERFFHLFDDFITFPGYPGLPEQKFIPKDFTVFLAEVQNREFDLVLQMQGNGTIVNRMTELFGAGKLAGFYHPSDYKPEGLFLPYPDGIHEIDRHLALMEFLGIESKGRGLEFPLTEKDESDLEMASLQVEPGKYICLHPGARSVTRQWAAIHFASLARYCHNHGFEIVLTGTKDEAELIQAVINHLDFPVHNACGRTSMGAMAVLIRQAFLLIVNCTGVSHIAAAMKTPSIVVSMHGEPERWSPIDDKIHRTIDWSKNPDFDLVFSETASLVNALMLEQEV